MLKSKGNTGETGEDLSKKARLTIVMDTMAFVYDVKKSKQNFKMFKACKNLQSQVYNMCVLKILLSLLKL